MGYRCEKDIFASGVAERQRGDLFNKYRLSAGGQPESGQVYYLKIRNIVVVPLVLGVAC